MKEEEKASHVFLQKLIFDFWDEKKTQYEFFVPGKLRITRLFVEIGEEIQRMITQTDEGTSVEIWLKFRSNKVEPYRFHIGKI